MITNYVAFLLLAIILSVLAVIFLAAYLWLAEIITIQNTASRQDLLFQSNSVIVSQVDLSGVDTLPVWPETTKAAQVVLPSEFRHTNLTPVRDQGTCNACVAFASTGAVADIIAIKTLDEIRLALSPQQLISCADNAIDCNTGGNVMSVLRWWQSHFLYAEESIPYTQHDSLQKTACAFPVRTSYQVILETMFLVHQGGSNLPVAAPVATEYIQQIKYALYQQGPLFAVMDIYTRADGTLDLAHYNADQIYTPDPTQLTVHGAHAVEIVGWGTTAATGDFWWVKNTWGTSWPPELSTSDTNRGYFRIRAGTNCAHIESWMILLQPITLRANQIQSWRSQAAYIRQEQLTQSRTRKNELLLYDSIANGLLALTSFGLTFSMTPVFLYVFGTIVALVNIVGLLLLVYYAWQEQLLQEKTQRMTDTAEDTGVTETLTITQEESHTEHLLVEGLPIYISLYSDSISHGVTHYTQDISLQRLQKYNINNWWKPINATLVPTATENYPLFLPAHKTWTTPEITLQQQINKLTLSIAYNSAATLEFTHTFTPTWPEDTAYVAFSSRNNSQIWLYMNVQGIYRSIDNTRTWTQVFSTEAPVWGHVALQHQGNTIYAQAYNTTTYEVERMSSTDEGNTWSTPTTLLTLAAPAETTGWVFSGGSITPQGLVSVTFTCVAPLEIVFVYTETIRTFAVYDATQETLLYHYTEDLIEETGELLLPLLLVPDITYQLVTFRNPDSANGLYGPFTSPINQETSYITVSSYRSQSLTGDTSTTPPFLGAELETDIVGVNIKVRWYAETAPQSYMTTVLEQSLYALLHPTEPTLLYLYRNQTEIQTLTQPIAHGSSLALSYDSDNHLYILNAFGESTKTSNTLMVQPPWSFTDWQLPHESLTDTWFLPVSKHFCLAYPFWCFYTKQRTDGLWYIVLYQLELQETLWQKQIDLTFHKAPMSLAYNKRTNLVLLCWLHDEKRVYYMFNNSVLSLTSTDITWTDPILLCESNTAVNYSTVSVEWHDKHAYIQVLEQADGILRTFVTDDTGRLRHQITGELLLTAEDYPLTW